MNDLPTLLHQRADRAALQPVDLDAVTRAGERRVRSRRLTTYAAGLALAGALASTALPDGGDGTDRALDPAAQVPATGVSWFLDGRLHHDGTSTDLGIDVATYVRTGAGFVLVDTGGTVWSWTGGEPRRVGRAVAGPPRLAGDSDGSSAAWVEGDGADRGLVVLDQTTGLTTELQRTGTGEAWVSAVEGDRVWWREGERSLTWSAASGGTPTLLPDGTTVLAAEADRVVSEVDGQIRTSVGAGTSTVLDEEYRDVGALSADGAWWSGDADQVRVVRTADGATAPLVVDADFSTGVAWLGPSTLVVLTGRGDLDDGSAMSAGLAVCEVPAGPCETITEDLGTFAELEDGDFALPVGVEVG